LPDLPRRNTGDFCPSDHPSQLAKVRPFSWCTVPI